MKNSKILKSVIISVVSLIFVTFGSTYAYFTLGSINNFGTKSLTANVANLGNVAITFGADLTMDLLLEDMLDVGNDVTYYASSKGKTTVETTENVGIITVAGNGTFDCNYKMVIDDNESNLYDAFQAMPDKTAGQIVLTVNGVAYDFTASKLFPKTISGTINDVSATNSKNITAQLKLINKTKVNQNALSNKSITLSFKITQFNCSLNI